MKILIITGELASGLVKDASLKSAHDVQVHMVKTPIAAFLTPNKMIRELRTLPENELISLDMILTPGLIRKDVSPIQEEIGIPAYKGSTDAADLDIVLEMVDKLDLSTKKSADKLIEEEQRRRALKYISDFEKDKKNTKKLLKKDGNILVGDLPVGEDFPMRVLAEIANAPLLSHEELLKRAKYFVKSGANMVDIGMIAGENMASKIPPMVKLLKENLDVPVSIDTLQTEEIRVAADSGVDMVLSLDHGNYQEVLPYLHEENIPAVILPTDYQKGWVPETIEERVKSLIDLKKKCNRIKVIADPILDPLNSKSMVDSIIACRKFKEATRLDPCPIFFGIGNVTELLDVDSVGVNALLAGISMELGASVLFTPEESGKTLGSVKELAVSSKMMFLAKMRGSIPKDLGINLLVFKDKRRGETILEEIDAPTIEGVANYKFVRDPAGSFKINLVDGRIMTVHYHKMQPTLVIYGQTAKEIYDEIIKRELVSRIEHAAYLGQELQKAEDALKLGKNYVQDFPIFHKFMEYQI
ncbi:dihydropteroate synthase-like protein [Methanobacterium petrolearium]|uniref:dihydropteroate synthase-like protein n=1 Tax=Methanobacterium petrolearium TaxID=710190 RepID=UPI001AE6718E|nr:dihydropteroate synthase-like protein [Methanobacterium petrolearium]MBP1945978.1 dihydropteroate synthase-like protein [Methanobacterium petrolearium]BDZ72203.1 dihydropteroate synthase [Methanobacterium petrolearium]